MRPRRGSHVWDRGRRSSAVRQEQSSVTQVGGPQAAQLPEGECVEDGQGGQGCSRHLLRFAMTVREVCPGPAFSPRVVALVQAPGVLDEATTGQG